MALAPQVQGGETSVDRTAAAARLPVALVVAFVAGVVLAGAVAGLSGSVRAAAASALAGALMAGLWTWRSGAGFGAAAASRGRIVIACVATLGAVITLGRLAVFMVDASQARFSTVPWSNWEVRHSCLTAYFVAGEAVGNGKDPYDPALYNAPGDDPAAVRKPRMMGAFNVDVYEYPPPFLLLPRLCERVTGGFLRMRSLWFGLNLAIVVLALPFVARSLGPDAAPRALLLAPLVLFAVPTLSGLQKGNIQLAIVALSMLAMVLFEGRRNAAGGALLAFTTASKLYPGLLVLYLIGRRQWRAVAWTVAMGLGYVVVTMLDVGWPPFAGFLKHLPGLLGGEAFPAFRNPAAIAINSSLPGLVFKLKLFGVPGMGFVLARVVGTASTLLVMWLVLRAARAPQRHRQPAIVWLSILVMATLCSPFLPQAYAAYPPLWLLTLLAAVAAPPARSLAVVVGIGIGLNVAWPTDSGLDPRVLAALNLVPQSLTLALALVGLRRRPLPMAG